MAKWSKISPAFEPLLADSKPNDKHDAIVILREREPLGSLVAAPPRQRRRALKARLERVKEISSEQHVTQERLVDTYLKSLSAKNAARGKTELEARPIGSGALPLAQVEVTRETLQELKRDDDVEAIMPNQKVHLIRPARATHEEPSRYEKQRGLTWGLEALEAPKLWETTQGEGVSVAVLDTGVHDSHPALQGRVREFMVFDPLGRRIKAEPAFDGGEHGTHVCGTIAGGRTTDDVAIGVAPKAELLAGGVLVATGTLIALVEGLSWAVERGADVINMSLGFPAFEPYFTILLDRIIDRYGILPVVSIGNENHGNSSSPGNSPAAFSVGAVGQGGRRSSLVVASFSSGASLEFPGEKKYPLITKPDVVAPGHGIYSAVPPQKIDGDSFEYMYMSGTSMAAPHVAGVAALLMAAKPRAPVRDIMCALKETAWHPSGTSLRPDNRWGHGMIRPIEALKVL